MSDEGYAQYGYDGKNTYVFQMEWGKPEALLLTYKSWQFRTNISSSAPQTLSKKSGNQLQRPMVTYGPSGSYRVSLKPLSEGKTSVHIFDLLGRLTFSKVFNEITETITFTIPAGNTPQTPFITRTVDKNGQTLQATIPVR